MLRISDLLDPSIRNAKLVDANLKAVLTLGVLLVIVAVLTLLCIVLPLALSTGLKEVAGATPLFVFFGSIGLGFMLIELSQMHRLILLLGHPTYGLSVVLFALLLSSGVGSFVSQRIRDIRRGGVRLLLVLLAVLALFGIVTPSLALAIEPWPTPVRIAVAVAMLFPLGLLLGMAFPLGLRVAVGRSQRLTPWLWGINGAASVLASVLATGIALTFSISTAYWAGACCYVVALLAFLVAAVPGGRATAEATP